MNLTEKEDIIKLHLVAFGEEEGEMVSNLAAGFLELEDTISFSVKRDETLAANVLFTPFVFEEHPQIKCYLLAPLGVLPEYRGTGVAREIMNDAISHLKSIGTDAVFVLGVPTLYPNFGFVKTDKETPYPKLLTFKDAWMALELNDGVLQKLSGKTVAVEPFMKPEFWDTSSRG